MSDLEIYPIGPSTERENKARNTQAKPIAPASAANASAFVQIPLSQVPGVKQFGSTRRLSAGALVDRALRFFATNLLEHLSTEPCASTGCGDYRAGAYCFSERWPMK
jgi:hypothetical protein